MDQRKIMALGKSSRVISLPKDWLNRNNLDRGNMVSLYVHNNGSLIVHPALDIKEDIKIIHLDIKADENADSIIRRIIGSYLDGYDVIKLQSDGIFTVDQQRAIRKIVAILYMMIVESEASSIVLETLIDELRVSVISGIERMHMITQSMCQDVLNSMRNLDETLVRSVGSLENDVDQLMFLLLRLIRGSATSPSLANQQGFDILDCLDHQTLVHTIERVADHSASMANSIIALIESKIIIPEKVMSTLIHAGENAFTSYDDSVRCYLSRDTGPTNEIIDSQKQIEDLYSEITPLPSFGDPSKTSALSDIINIRECIMKISHHAADVAELTIDRGYKSKNT